MSKELYVDNVEFPDIEWPTGPMALQAEIKKTKEKTLGHKIEENKSLQLPEGVAVSFGQSIAALVEHTKKINPVFAEDVTKENNDISNNTNNTEQTENNHVEEGGLSVKSISNVIEETPPTINHDLNAKTITIQYPDYRYECIYFGKNFTYCKSTLESGLVWSFMMSTENHQLLLDGRVTSVLVKEYHLYHARIREINEQFYKGKNFFTNLDGDNKFIYIPSAALYDLATKSRSYLLAKYGSSTKAAQLPEEILERISNLSRLVNWAIGLKQQVLVTEEDLVIANTAKIGKEVPKNELKQGNCYYIDNGDYLLVYRFLSIRQDGVTLFTNGTKSQKIIRISRPCRYYSIKSNY